MTEKQAYKILTNTPIRCKENHTEYSKALRIAIGALVKQIAKRPCLTDENVFIHNCLVSCPICKEFCGFKQKHCVKCGQALLWDGDEE